MPTEDYGVVEGRLASSQMIAIEAHRENCRRLRSDPATRRLRRLGFWNSGDGREQRSETSLRDDDP
jgi:hypothetical protein